MTEERHRAGISARHEQALRVVDVLGLAKVGGDGLGGRGEIVRINCRDVGVMWSVRAGSNQSLPRFTVWISPRLPNRVPSISREHVSKRQSL